MIEPTEKSLPVIRSSSLCINTCLPYFILIKTTEELDQDQSERKYTANDKY